MSDDKPSFVCIDCGYDVYVINDLNNEWHQTRCSTCAWLYHMKLPEEEKAKLRKIFDGDALESRSPQTSRG